MTEQSAELPQGIRQDISTFETFYFPGLQVAAFAMGNMAHLAQAIASPEQPTIQELTGYAPDLSVAQRTPFRVNRNITDCLEELWRQKYANDVQPTIKSVPNNQDEKVGLSPLTKEEQDVAAAYVRDFMHNSNIGGHIHRHVDRPEVAEKLIIPNVHASILGIVSDVIALPRIMAGMDFANERNTILNRILPHYYVDAQGVIGNPKNENFRLYKIL